MASSPLVESKSTVRAVTVPETLATEAVLQYVGFVGGSGRKRHVMMVDRGANAEAIRRDHPRAPAPGKMAPRSTPGRQDLGKTWLGGFATAKEDDGMR